MNCRICDGQHLVQMHDFGNMPVAGYLVETVAQALAAERFQSRLVFCEACGLAQQYGDAFKGVLIKNVYSNYRPTYSMSSKVRDYMSIFISEALAFVDEIGRNDIVLEIGSNDGSMLDLLRSQGFRPAGIDPSAQASDGRDDAIVIRDFFSKEVAIKFAETYGKVKLLYSRHTLEHVFEPLGFVEAIGLLLDDNGVAVVEVPYLPAQLNGNQFAAMTFQHISFFTLTSLKRLAEICGLIIVNAKISKMDGGSIILILAKSSRAAPFDTRMAEGLMELERATGVNEARGLLTRFEDIGQAVSLIRDHVSKLREKSYRIVGYGAGAKGQALLNMVGLSRDIVQCVVDDTPGSKGMYVPGVGTEVVDSTDPRLADADIVLITAPTHVEEIVTKELAKHPTTSFIRTSPELSYVSNL